jgi:tetratricopeptide (TPR) repeat protein
MQEAIRRLTQAQEVARTARKKGDALSRAGRPETDVFAAYEVGVKALEKGIDSVDQEHARLDAIAAPVSGEAAEFLHQLVESHGALGGLRQRVNRLEDALASYSAGAALEEKFALPSTYNRLNKLKQTLLIRQDISLSALEPQIEALARQIESALRTNQSLSDSGWAWADLGDCLALLGRTDESARAYATFIAKAEIKSPERTLDVLRLIASKLLERLDPGAVRLQAAIDALQGRLAGR